jgi:hypothetical protein
MTTPYQQPDPQQYLAPGTGPEDLLAQRPAMLSDPGRLPAAPTGRPSLTSVLAGVVVAALLFAGGLLVGHATSASAAAPPAGLAGGARAFAGGGAGGAGAGGGGLGAGGGAGRAGGAGGGFTAGQIASVSGSTLTVTKADGSTVTVTTTPSTTVTQTTQSGVSALKVGETVTVVGPAAADGSVAAQRISSGTGGLGAGGRGGVPTPRATS